MKKIFSAVILLIAFSVNAEVITVNLPKAGTYLVTASRPESCTPTEFSLAAIERGFGNDMAPFLNVDTARITNLFGSSMECRTGANTATGVFIVQEKTLLNITLAPGLEESSVSVSEVVKTRSLR